MTGPAKSGPPPGAYVARGFILCPLLIGAGIAASLPPLIIAGALAPLAGLLLANTARRA